MSQKLSFDWVDAFSARPFGGNGCAVVHGGVDLPEQTCLDFVRETSLVECTFTGPSKAADVRVRYFLASREIPFAGHPTLATVAALLHRGLVAPPRVTLETAVGVLEIDIDTTRYPAVITMTQVAPEFGRTVPADRVAALMGLGAGDVLGVPQFVSTGLPFCITVLKDHDALRRAAFQPDQLAAYQDDFVSGTSDLGEPYLITLEGASGSGDTYGRLLMLPPSPPEDPFTGSATGAAAAYLWHHGLIDSPRYVAEQGHDMGRPGQAQVEVLGPPGAITGVRVGGQGHVLMSGELRL